MPQTTHTADDRTLLRHYAHEGSEAAFRELVRRHVDAVFSAARRRLNGDTAVAEDVTQQVFTDLARKAPSLPPDVVLGGWLHRHTGFCALKAIDRERRRRRRETEAATMNATLESPPDARAWSEVAPLLDAALDSLPATDRDALVLRFFEKRDLRAVGAALGVSDDTAQKRVTRALDKVRTFLARRGVTSTAGALGALVAAQAVDAAPAGFAHGVPGHALAAAAVRGGSLFLRESLRWKVALAAAAAAVAVAAPLAVQQRRITALEQRNRELAANISVLATAPAPPPPLPPAPRAKTAQDLVAEAAVVLRGGAQDVTSTTKALALLAEIDGADREAALTAVAGVSDEAAQALLFKYLISRWAESEPFPALAYVQEKLPFQCRAGVYDGVLTAWAGKNPDSALAWFGKAGGSAPPPLRESLLATIFRGLGSRDLPLAFDRLGWLKSETERAQGLRGLLEAVDTPQERTLLWDRSATVADDELRLQTRRALIEQWGQQAPAEAAAFVEKCQPAWERERFMDSLGLVWLQRDAATAADWWATQAPGADTLVKIMNVWAHEDPNAAGEWFCRQPPGPSSDPARQTFARQVADIDPVSALRWGETISDGAMREATLEHVFGRWHARDAAAAAAFLQKASWPAERVARLAGGRAEPQPKNQP